MVDLPEIDIDECGKIYNFTVEDHPFQIEVISSTEDYIRVLQSVFDFPAISTLFKRSDFSFYFDAIHGGIGKRLVSIHSIRRLCSTHLPYAFGCSAHFST